MKPGDTDVAARTTKHIEPHPRPTLASQLLTAAKLFAVSGALFLALWFVDEVVTSG
jgi:hypothetical protein